MTLTTTPISHECPSCHGEGKVEVYTHLPWVTHFERCEACGGEGTVTRECWGCSAEATVLGPDAVPYCAKCIAEWQAELDAEVPRLSLVTPRRESMRDAIMRVLAKCALPPEAFEVLTLRDLADIYGARVERDEAMRRAG